MILEIIRQLLILIVLLTLQFTFVPFISINGIIPDIVLIYVVIFTLKFGQLKGTVFGFIVGFFFDVFSGGLIGSAMFSKTLAAFIAGYFYKEEHEEVCSNVRIFVSIIFLCALINSIFYAVLGSVEIELNILSLLFNNGIFPALYTSIIAFAFTLLIGKR